MRRSPSLKVWFFVGWCGGVVHHSSPASCDVGVLSVRKGSGDKDLS